MSRKANDLLDTAAGFSPWSATTLITICQRLNMNAVRLPLLMWEYARDADYRERAGEVVRIANRLELLVLAEGDNGSRNENAAEFWSRCAADFRDNPNVMFAVGMQEVVGVIRASGARQPIVIEGPPGQGMSGFGPNFPIADANIIYAVSAHFSNSRNDKDRWDRFGAIAEQAPVLVAGLDPQLDLDSEECRQFPGDPGTASSLVEENLAYFDRHNISWTLSSFEPRKLIADYRNFVGTKLDDGWTSEIPEILAQVSDFFCSLIYGAPTPMVSSL